MPNYFAQGRLWRADMQGNKLDLLQPSRSQRATVSFNIDMRAKRQLTVDVENPGAILPLGDFLMPELIIRSEQGEKVYPLGHFVALPPNTTLTSASYQGTLQGRDVTYMMDRAGLPEGYVVEKGENPSHAARRLAAEWGMPWNRIRIPDTGRALEYTMEWEPGESVLTVINDLCTAARLLNPWTDGLGNLTTREELDLCGCHVDGYYGPDSDAIPLSPVTDQLDIGRLKNQVTVRKVMPGEPTISYTARITNPQHPLHPVRLQERLGASQPVIWADVPVEDLEITSVEDAKQRAEALLSYGASYYRKTFLQTTVDDVLDGHQIVVLDLGLGPDRLYTGKWLQRTWTVQLQGLTATVRRELVATLDWK